MRAAWRGAKLVLHAPQVKKTYLQLAAAIFAVAAVLDVAGIWAVVHFTPIDSGEAWWWVAWLWVLRVVGIAIVLFTAPIVAMFTVNSLVPLLAERVFLAGMATVAPDRAKELGERKGLPLSTALVQSLIRLFLFLGMSVLAFAISLVPVVGSVAGPVVHGYFTARTLSWELLDPYFDKLELGFDAQHDFVKQHRLPLVGLGLPFALVMAIPFVGSLVFGLAQATAGVFVAEVIEDRRP
jgi:CysZ protein